MKVKDLSELLYRMYYNSTPSAQGGFELKDFTLAVQDARGYKIKTDYWNQSKLEGEATIDPIWIKTYKKIPVFLDKEMDMYVSELPAEPFGVPSMGGIYRICPMQDLTSPFHKVTATQVFLYTSVPKTFTTFYYDNKRIYYQNILPDYCKSGVLMMIIPAIDDEIPDAMTYEIRELVLNQFMKNRVPVDKLSDNNPNLPQNEPATK